VSACATCKHLGQPNGVYFWPEDGADDIESEHRECNRIPHGNGTVTRETLTAPAIVTDGSGYVAKLRVLPTFGCALHEGREGRGGGT
jgi:hypothetical protein